MKKKAPPIVVPKPKRRIPVPPPQREHRDRKAEQKRMPSLRRAKHKKLLDERE